MNNKSIILTSCGHFDKSIINAVAEDVSIAFNLPVYFKECTMDISGYYNPGRRQYNADKIMELITSKMPNDALKMIGLVKIDLFIPILTYIFGQAPLNGQVGIVSLYRLRNELYGLKKNDTLLMDRFSKVVIHETGHLFGLIHCITPTCVMRSSTYVEDIDQKSKQFCTTCLSQLKNKYKSLKLT